MKILLYIPKKAEVPERKLQMLRDRSVECLRLSPTLLSAFGAMKIAAEVKKNGIDIVECTTAKDAMAAISARKLTEPRFAIVVNIPPNSDIPKGIHPDIRQDVDAWIFPSERLAKAYPEDLKNKTVIPPVSFEIVDEIPYPSDCSSYILTWIAPITDAQQLIEVIKAFEKSTGNARLRICGTGKAANVMPAVRYARACKKAAQIEWLADKFDTKEEIAKAHAIVASNEDITEIEAAAVHNGRPRLKAEEIIEFVDGHRPVIYEDALSGKDPYYPFQGNAGWKPAHHVDKLTEIYNKIRIQ